MASLNLCQFIGRIGKAPETRTTNAGQKVSSFSLAVDESYKDKQGNKVEGTEWITCNAWDRTSDFVSQYLDKGRLVFVSGKWKTRKWQDKDSGADRYATELTVLNIQGLDKKPDGQSIPVPRPVQTRPEMDELDDAPF